MELILLVLLQLELIFFFHRKYNYYLRSDNVLTRNFPLYRLHSSLCLTGPKKPQIICYLDCRKTCVKRTLNSACDACTCDDHVLTGRVQNTNNAPIAGAKVALSETPYKALTRTGDKGFFKALNVCADANQELLISAAGFVPVKMFATVSASTSANVLAKLQKSGTLILLQIQSYRVKFSLGLKISSSLRNPQQLICTHSQRAASKSLLGE